jgi:Mg2+ and Co2+ transporter CorA
MVTKPHPKQYDQDARSRIKKCFDNPDLDDDQKVKCAIHELADQVDYNQSRLNLLDTLMVENQTETTSRLDAIDSNIENIGSNVNEMMKELGKVEVNQVQMAGSLLQQGVDIVTIKNSMATKEDLERFATKEDLEHVNDETIEELHGIENDIIKVIRENRPNPDQKNEE